MQAQLPLPQSLSQSLSTLHWVVQHPGGTLSGSPSSNGCRTSLAHAPLGGGSTEGGAMATVPAITAPCGVIERVVRPPAAISAATARRTRNPWFLVIRFPPLCVGIRYRTVQ